MVLLALDGDRDVSVTQSAEDPDVFFELEGGKQGMAVLCALSYRFTTEFRKDAGDSRI